LYPARGLKGEASSSFSFIFLVFLLSLPSSIAKTPPREKSLLQELEVVTGESDVNTTTGNPLQLFVSPPARTLQVGPTHPLKFQILQVWWPCSGFNRFQVQKTGFHDTVTKDINNVKKLSTFADRLVSQSWGWLLNIANMAVFYASMTVDPRYSSSTQMM